MAKELTNEEILQIGNDLQDKKSAKRRSAAKKIRKYKIRELGDALYWRDRSMLGQHKGREIG